MYILHFLLGSICLFNCVRSVILEDAVEKSWTKYSFGQLSHFDVTPDRCIVGISGEEQLGRYRLDTNQMEWIVSLKQHRGSVNRYQSLGGGLALLYSNSSAMMYFYDVKSGILQRETKSPQIPLQVESVSGMGVMVLGSDGALYYYDYETQSFSKGEHLAATRFIQFKHEGQVYIVTESGAVLAFSQWDREFTRLKSKVSGVVEAYDGLLVSEKGLHQIDGSGIKSVVTTSNQKQVAPIYNNMFVEYTVDSLNVYKISESRATVLHSLPLERKVETIYHLTYGLNDFVAVTFEDFHQDDIVQNLIIDFTDFIATEDPETIKSNPVFSFRGSKVFPIYSKSKLEWCSVTNSKTGLKVSTTPFGGSATFNNISMIVPDASHALLMDMPISKSAIKKVHEMLDNTSYHTITVNWLRRLKRHLSELGRGVVKVFYNTGDDASYSLNVDEFGLEKLLVYPSVDGVSLVAVNSRTGSLEWESANFISELVDLVESDGSLYVVLKHRVIQIDPTNGKFVDETHSDVAIEKAIKITGSTNNHALFLHLEDGSFKKFAPREGSEDQFLVQHEDSRLQAYKIKSGNTIKTWNIDFSSKAERVVNVVNKPESVCSSAGIILHNKSVLYKYLNQNLFAVVTKGENVFKIYLINGVLGDILGIVRFGENENIESETISLVMDDNWIVYSYFTRGPEFEQRLAVIDLFDSSKAVKGGEISSFTFNNTIDYLSSKSFKYPERILELSSTNTQKGITIKSIIALTTSGKLVEIPKYILNSRRVDDREMNQNDYKDDFRMTPYDPIIPMNSQSVLNHKQQLVPADKNKILNIPTNLESTSVLCTINQFSTFCGLVQPSSSYDTLSSKFDKLKLLFTMFVLLALYLSVKPFVYRKKLNSEWIDR